MDTDALARLAEDAPSPIALHDTRQTILWANAAYRAATGLTLQQIQGTKCFAAWGREKPCRGCPVIESLRTGQSAEAELTPDNQDHWPEKQGAWLAQAAPLRDESGALVGVIETAHEITDRRRVEAEVHQANQQLRASEQQLRAANQQLEANNQQLRASDQQLRAVEQQLRATNQQLQVSEEMYRTLVESTLQGIVIAQSDPLRLAYANPAMAALTGYTPDELTAMGAEALAGLVHPECRERFFDTFARRLAGEPVPATGEYRLRRKDGDDAWVLLHSSVIRHQGRPATLTAFVDTTDRRRAEQELRRFEWLLDKESPGAGQRSDDYDPPYADPTELNTARVIRDAVGPQALEGMARDLMDLLDTSVALYEANGDYAYGLFESRWCRLLDGASFALCDTPDTQTALACGKWLCHENCWHDSARTAMRTGKITDIKCVGGIRLYAVPIRAGEEIVGVINVGYGQPPDDEGTLKELSERFGVEIDQIRQAAQAYKPRPQYIIDVAKRRCHSIAQAIGETVERARMKAQLAQADRLTSMGVLAGGLAHEINNPLAYVLFNLDSLAEDLPGLLDAVGQLRTRLSERLGAQTVEAAGGDALARISPLVLDDMLERFADAKSGSERIRDVVRGLGPFSRADQDTLGPVQLERVIDAAAGIAANEIRHRATLVKEHGQGLPPVRGSEGRLSQVFLNLIVNAVHAIDEGDAGGNQIRITTWAESDLVCAQVADTGSGIAPEHLPRLFDPFFTTKPVGTGSGLGLAISRKIVEEFGGSLSVESEPGAGSRFTVRLPAHFAHSADIEQQTAPDTERETSERGRILVVDDEDRIRATLVRMLEKHEVVEAASGAEAKEILAGDQAFELILCDMMMPQVSGMDLHRWLAEAHPGLAERLIFITGGAFTPKAREYLSLVDNPHLDKPFDMAAVRRTVDERIRAWRGSDRSGKP